MAFELIGKVAIVTGAQRGIGLAIVRALANAGAKVTLTGIDGRAGEKAVSELARDGLKVWFQLSDTTNAEDVKSVVSKAILQFGQLDILVANAAIYPNTAIADLPAVEWDAVMAVNLRGPFFGCQVIGAHMQARGAGRIINISSQAGQMGGTVAGAHYAASKAGVILLTKYFAREFAASGITVNAVAPGALDFPAVRAAFPPERVKALEAMIPVQHLGNPQEVAAAVALLAQEDMAYVTGATWDINGGVFMR